MSYQEKFTTLKESFNQNDYENFIANPLPVLESAGIPIVKEWQGGGGLPSNISNLSRSIASASASVSANAAIAESEHMEVKVDWWGVDFIMNEKLTQDIIAGTETTGALASIIAGALGAAGVVTAGIATALGAGLAAAFIVKIAEISIINNGHGVHFPISWLQWGPLILSVPSGPGGITVASLVFIHPVRN